MAIEIGQAKDEAYLIATLILRLDTGLLKTIYDVLTTVQTDLDMHMAVRGDPSRMKPAEIVPGRGKCNMMLVVRDPGFRVCECLHRINH